MIVVRNEVIMKFYYEDNILFSEKPPHHFKNYTCLSEKKAMKIFTKNDIEVSIEKRYTRITSLRTTENMWLRLSAFTQTLLRKASHILKRCVKSLRRSK